MIYTTIVCHASFFLFCRFAQNRNNAKCRDLVNEGALKGNNPADVVHQCDLIFSCVSDGPALKDLVYGNCGVLQSIGPGKRFVDLSTVSIAYNVCILEIYKILCNVRNI